MYLADDEAQAFSAATAVDSSKPSESEPSTIPTAIIIET